MFTVAQTAVVTGSPAEVFEVAADPLKQLQWDPGTLKAVERLTPGPLGQGARYRGTFKGFGKVEYEFAEYEPPRRFAHLASIPMGKMRHVFTFEAVPEGTRIGQKGTLTPNLLGRVAWPFVSRMLRKRFRLIGTEIAGYMERTAGASEA